MTHEPDSRIQGIEETIRDAQRDSKNLPEQKQQEFTSKEIEGRTKIGKIVDEEKMHKEDAIQTMRASKTLSTRRNETYVINTGYNNI